MARDINLRITEAEQNLNMLKQTRKFEQELKKLKEMRRTSRLDRKIAAGKLSSL